jgi:Protein of unknown function (DUF3131)
MTLQHKLIAARSYIVFILGLLIAFSAVIWIEYRTGFGIAAAAPAIQVSSDRSAGRAPRKLSGSEREWARVAWKYFEKNVAPETGLPGSVENYPSATMWDIGSYLLAVISAKQLQLIDNAEFDRRIGTALASLAKLPLFDKQLPNKAYNTKTLQMTDYANKDSERGVGWSVIDIGRLLVPINVLVWQYPQHSAAARKVIATWNVSRLSREGELYGARVGKDGKTELVQEGRLGYEQYAAKTFSLMGLDVTAASNYQRQIAHVNVYGVQVAHDRRIPRLFGAHNYVISEPYVLDGLEFGWDNVSRELAWRVYSAQQRRHERTGVLTAVTEDHIDQKPYFVYNTVFSDGKVWNTITDTGADASTFRSLSVKAAFGWYGLFDTDYARKLVGAVDKLFDAERGWYEATGKPNKSVNGNTNAVVLQSLAYIEKGPFIHYDEPAPGAPK